MSVEITLESLLSVPRSGTCESCSNSVSNFSRNCHTVFHHGHIIYIPTSSAQWSLFLHIFDILMGVKPISCGWIGISLMISDVKHLFICLLAILSLCFSFCFKLVCDLRRTTQLKMEDSLPDSGKPSGGACSHCAGVRWGSVAMPSLPLLSAHSLPSWNLSGILDVPCMPPCCLCVPLNLKESFLFCSCMAPCPPVILNDSDAQE